VHFIALDNVSRAKPEIGADQLAWLKKRSSAFFQVRTNRRVHASPLFDLRPDWEWFTSDGDDVMNALSPYDNVTVL